MRKMRGIKMTDNIESLIKETRDLQIMKFWLDVAEMAREKGRNDLAENAENIVFKEVEKIFKKDDK